MTIFIAAILRPHLYFRGRGPGTRAGNTAGGRLIHDGHDDYDVVCSVYIVNLAIVALV